MTGRQIATRAVPTTRSTARKVITRRRARTAALPMACWAWTRGVLLLFTYNVVPYISHGDIVGDVKTYNRWSQAFASGHFPLHDPQWQYPPGAAFVITLPRLVRSLTGLSYYTSFYAIAVLADLITFLLVVYRCWHTAEWRGGESEAESGETEAGASRQPVPIGGAQRIDRPIDYTGAWAYVVAIFMIGPIVYGRYDIVVAMTATLGLVVSTGSAAWTWRLRGVAIGAGTLLKLWPAALLVGLPKRIDGRRALLWTGLAALLPTLALTAALPGSFSFLAGQQGRGLEIESVLASPFLLARRAGYPGVVRHQYGAFQITGPGIGAALTCCEVLTVAGFAWLLWWRRRANLAPGRWSTTRYYDAALVAVLVAIVTSRVLSPQYLVWVVALIALCLTRPDSVVTGPCWLLLAAISLTQLEFPLLFPRLIADGHWAPWFVAGRNLMLLVATLWAARSLWRSVAADPAAAAALELTAPA